MTAHIFCHVSAPLKQYELALSLLLWALKFPVHTMLLCRNPHSANRVRISSSLHIGHQLIGPGIELDIIDVEIANIKLPCPAYGGIVVRLVTDHIH